jgi:hypothetical protein
MRPRKHDSERTSSTRTRESPFEVCPNLTESIFYLSKSRRMCVSCPLGCWMPLRNCDTSEGSRQPRGQVWGR